MNRLLRVLRKTLLTPRMVRVTLGGLAGNGLARFAGPDRRVKMFFPADGGRATPALPRTGSGGPVWLPGAPRPAIRTYTVRRFDAAAGELDVDFVLHDGPGPAARWARQARPGDEVGMSEPGGRYAPDPAAAWHLLVGDESALPALATVLEVLPPGALADVFVEVADAAEEQPLPSAARAVVRWVHRGRARHGDRLATAVRAAAMPAGRGQAWVSAEAGAVHDLRAHLLDDRGLERRLLYATNYWRAGPRP